MATSRNSKNQSAGTTTTTSTPAASTQQPANTRQSAGQWGHWLGRYGEEAAAHYLRGAGYQVIERNWVCRD